ncbi:hypothetical protein X946_5479 [Burkholderia sp. ABCPW 111]|nr:hypothetical protein X946_5479 [Burkholderia sp. ABCPW 111]
MIGRARIAARLRVAVSDADEQRLRRLIVRESAPGVVTLGRAERRERIGLVACIAVIDAGRERPEAYCTAARAVSIDLADAYAPLTSEPSNVPSDVPAHASRVLPGADALCAWK